MDAELDTKLDKLRVQREKLFKKRNDRLSDLRFFIKSNLDIFRYVLEAEFQKRPIAETSGVDVLLIFNDRLDKAKGHCLKELHSIFKSLMIPKAKIKTFLENGNEERTVENPTKILDNLLKMVYSIDVLRSKVAGRVKCENSSLTLSINIISMTCKFFNGRDSLCILDPIDLQWPYSEEYSKVFEKDFHLPFDIENMKSFILENKLSLLTKNLDSLCELNLTDFEILLSYSFFQRYGDTEILREGEMEEKDNVETFQVLMREIYKKIDDFQHNEKFRALVFSYIILKYKGLVNYVDTEHFRGTAVYYYVHWIDHLKHKNSL